MLLSDIKHIEFDLTAKCNALCPQCSRADQNFAKIYNKKEVTLDLIKKWIPLSVLDNLKLVTFKGTFSEPIIATEFLEIIEFFCNSTLAKIRITSNASIKNSEWWTRLAKISAERIIVRFAIDGLEDTHHLYRINTSYKRILDNAKSFIAAGGRAEWQYIIFRHNEHQVDHAKQLSKSLGFEKFILLNNDRFVENHLITPKGTVLEKSYYDTDPTFNDFKKQIGKKIIDIECKSQTTGWIAIDWDGDVWPCCFTQVWKDKFNPYALDAQVWRKVKANRTNNLNENSLENILHIFNDLFELHNQKRIPVVCSKYCNKC